MLPHVLLEQQAERCIKLAYQCQNKNAERFLRLLAVDLMLAAQLRRPQEAASERPAAARSSGQAKFQAPDADAESDEPHDGAKPETVARPQAANEPPAPARPDVLSVLATLSRQTRGAAPRRGTQLTPESASTA